MAGGIIVEGIGGSHAGLGLHRTTNAQAFGLICFGRDMASVVATVSHTNVRTEPPGTILVPSELTAGISLCNHVYPSILSDVTVVPNQPKTEESS